MARFINPFTDWGFKTIFGQEINKDLLISFLNDLLDGEHVIADITFGDKEQLPELKDMRGIVCDIYCTTDKNEHVIVEMQNRYQEHFIDRSLFYASRAIVKQGIKGSEWDYSLAPVYTVCFMNFNVADITLRKFRTDVMLMDIDSGKVFSDNLRFIYLMLPMFGKDEAECDSDFERWIYILKNMSTFERMPFLARNAVFKRLAEIADISALSKEERDEYDESIKRMRDVISLMTTAKNEGRKEGREEVREEGREEERKEFARMMLLNNEPMDKIRQYTGLSEQEIMAMSRLNGIQV